MTKWYVKDLSKLTNITVQTLHHYDRINLLKPSSRLANGYRVYSEKDLLQLQQIIVLKILGFKLKIIKALLTDGAGALEHFTIQSQFLEQKGNTLLNTSKAIKCIISDVQNNKSITWKTIIKLIKVYFLAHEIENNLEGDILTPEKLLQCANIELDLDTRFTPDEKDIFAKKWQELINQVQLNIEENPNSNCGIDIGKQIMDLVNEKYGKKNANLRI